MLSASLSLTDMLLSSSSHMHAPIVMALEDALGETFQQHRMLLRAVRTVLLALLPQLAMFSYWLHAQLVKLWTSADKQHYDFVLQLHDNDDNTYSLKRHSHAESFLVLLSDIMQGSGDISKETSVEPGWQQQGTSKKICFTVALFAAVYNMWMPQRLSNVVIKHGSHKVCISSLGVRQECSAKENKGDKWVLWMQCANIKALQALMKDMHSCVTKHYHPPLTERMVNYHLDGYIMTLNSTPWKDLLLAADVRESIDACLQNGFEQTSSRHACVLLLHGPPGTGKSTIVTSLASKLRRCVTCRDTFLGISTAMRSEIQHKLLVVEECDRVLAKDLLLCKSASHEVVDGSKTMLQTVEQKAASLQSSLQMLQQLMSGCTPHGLFLVFTTNDLPAFRRLLAQAGIDADAFLRAGRVDACIKVGFIPGEYVREQWQARKPRCAWGRLATETPPAVPLVQMIEAMHSDDSDMLWRCSLPSDRVEDEAQAK